ncbi:hypothetical protein [Mycolicibacterium fortuitum]|uniref:hypothetical protein n=1 Tax=Mycolicibacterium fortuitum TaxID=1766 RepID=UPI000ACB25D7|nr:hypothetical protein [Mycolicibacterium fortuitum]
MSIDMTDVEFDAVYDLPLTAWTADADIPGIARQLERSVGISPYRARALTYVRREDLREDAGAGCASGCECEHEGVPRCCIAGELPPDGNDSMQCHGDGDHPEIACWCPCHGEDCPTGGDGPCRCSFGA